MCFTRFEKFPLQIQSSQGWAWCNACVEPLQPGTEQLDCQACLKRNVALLAMCTKKEGVVCTCLLGSLMQQNSYVKAGCKLNLLAE